MNIGRYVCTPLRASKSLREHSPRHTLKNPRSGENMNEKKQILYAVRITVTSYAAVMGGLEKIKSASYVRSSNSLTEALLSFMILAETQERASYVDGYMNEISDFMSLQLSELHKQLSNTLPLDIEDKELSLSIFHAAANGLMNYMKGSKQSKMDWFTTPDIVQK